MRRVPAAPINSARGVVSVAARRSRTTLPIGLARNGLPPRTSNDTRLQPIMVVGRTVASPMLADPEIQRKPSSHQQCRLRRVMQIAGCSSVV
jgi:hypothetical protein